MLAATGTVYSSASAMKDYLSFDAFRWDFTAPGAYNKNLVLLDTNPPRSDWLALRGTDHISESCCKFEPLGIGDGAKVLCSNAKLLSAAIEENEKMVKQKETPQRAEHASNDVSKAKHIVELSC